MWDRWRWLRQWWRMQRWVKMWNGQLSRLIWFRFHNWLLYIPIFKEEIKYWTSDWLDHWEISKLRRVFLLFIIRSYQFRWANSRFPLPRSRESASGEFKNWKVKRPTQSWNFILASDHVIFKVSWIEVTNFGNELSK